MKTSTIIFLAAAVLMIAAASVEAKGENKDAPSRADFKHLIGKTFVKHAGEKEDNTFSKADLPKSARVIFPGDKVTKDFRVDRLNVGVSKEGVAERVYYG